MMHFPQQLQPTCCLNEQLWIAGVELRDFNSGESGYLGLFKATTTPQKTFAFQHFSLNATMRSRL